MVGHNMNGPNREQVLRFMQEKERMEQEIHELHAVLETNNVGMHDPLVDAEGFPRADVDVYRVRYARHRIICLQNDHKEIMKQIERGLHLIHSEFIGSSGQGSQNRNNIEAMDTTEQNHRLTNGTSHTNGHVHMNGDVLMNGHGRDDNLAAVVWATGHLSVTDRAIVRINLVSPGSPAEDAGLAVGDEILQFGSVNASNFNNLTQIADIVQHSVGNTVNIRVRRNGTMMNVSLVPATWSGRGLLGCNIVPI